MGLQVWLPLNGDLTQQGLKNLKISTSNFSSNNSGKIGKCCKITSPLNLNHSVDWSKDNVSYCVWVKINKAEAQTAINTSSYDSSYTTAGGDILGQNNYGGLSIRWGTNDLNASSKTLNNIYLFASARCYNAAGTNSAYVYYTSSPSYNLSFDTWTHIALSYNGSTKQLNFYINGILNAAYTFSDVPSGVSGTKISTFLNSTYWHRGNGRGMCFPGYLNDVRVYDHALSAKEVAELAKGLVLHYRLSGPGQENLLLGTEKISSCGCASGITYTSQTDGSAKIVSTSGNGNWCRVYLLSNDDSYIGSALSVGDTYTISVDVKVESGTTLPTLFINGGNGYKQLQGKIVNGQWIRAYYTSTWNTPGTSYGNAQLHLGFSGAIGTYYFRHFKIERGSVQTPWCPNSADTLYSTLGYDNGIEYDCSGYKYNGIKKGAIAWDIDSPRYATSYKFSSIGDSITSTSAFSHLSTFTYSCWFKRSTNEDAFILMGYQYGNNSSGSLSVNSNGVAGFHYYQSATGSGDTQIGSSTNCNDGKWHHLVATYDGTTVITYLDGVQTASKNVSLLTTSRTFQINYPSGSQNGTDYRDFKGLLSDVRVYATALSASDIAELYHSAVIVDNTGKSYAYEYFEA